VPLLANVGIAADIRAAKENGAEGIGLYRTEFPFFIREHFPTREEQVRIYRRAYRVFPDSQINFRLLDLGADKFIRGASLGTDRNPFAGYRSIRVLFDHPEVLRDQVQAFAIAAGNRRVSILVPFVSSLEDVRRVRRLILDALEPLALGARPLLGVMIELPAAVEIASVLAHEVDYLSVGTNDLIQYAFGVDRENPRIAPGAEPYHPAVLRMIRRTVTAAHSQGKPISVCGEMAADRLLGVTLAALGVDSLSVAPQEIPGLKDALAHAELRPLEEELDHVLSLPDAASVKAVLKRLIE
jgi:phosphotransferase system enzyme I (PtsP)